MSTRKPSTRRIVLDSKGKRRYSLSRMGERYNLMRIAHPDWTMRACALAAGEKPERADASALRWEHHPDMELGASRSAFRERDDWVETTKRRGQTAEGAADSAVVAKDFSGAAALLGRALESSELLVKHVPMEGLLSGKDVAQPAGDTSLSLNLFAGWTLEELTAWLAENKPKLAEGHVVDRAD